MNYKIRLAKENEAKETILVRWKSWLFAYKHIFTKQEIDKHFEVKINNEEYRTKISNSIKNNKNWFVAEDNKKIVAVMSLGFAEQNNGNAEIYCLYCLPEYLRLGIGSKFFERAIKIFKKKGYKDFVVCAIKDNIIGNSFYTKKGGILVETFKKELCNKQVELIKFKFDIL